VFQDPDRQLADVVAEALPASQEKLALTFGDACAAYRCQVRRWV
jgi:hypothetical protein